MYWMHRSFGFWSSTFYLEDYNSQGMNTKLMFLLCALFIECKVVYICVCLCVISQLIHYLQWIWLGVQNGHHEWPEYFPVNLSKKRYCNSASKSLLFSLLLLWCKPGQVLNTSVVPARALGCACLWFICFGSVDWSTGLSWELQAADYCLLFFCRSSGYISEGAYYFRFSRV
jgi:hypothetical protein